MNETKGLAAVLSHHIFLHAKEESPMEGALQCQYNQV
jgi:hypothetical protein